MRVKDGLFIKFHNSISERLYVWVLLSQLLNGDNRRSSVEIPQDIKDFSKCPFATS